MLHDQASVHQRYLDEVQYQAQNQIMQNTKKSILENVNDKSDATLIKNFFEEHNRMIKGHLKSHMPLNLLDALERLHFIDQDILKEIDHQDANDRYKKLKVVLRDNNCNVQIASNAQNGGQTDLQKNLFKICCAILNLRANQRGDLTLDDNVLNQYLEQINSFRFSQDQTLVQ